MILTVEEYLAKHRVGHEAEITDQLMASAQLTVHRWNDLLAQFYADNPSMSAGFIVSGWRPISVNIATPGAAVASKHTTGMALDFTVAFLVKLFTWLLTMPEHELATFQLWFEDFRATPTWVHGQTVPPHSGSRFFIPDANWGARLAGHPLTLASLGVTHA